MNRIIVLTAFAMLSACGSSNPEDVRDASMRDTGVAPPGLRAFPRAMGFGTDTPGGRGGRVIAVTTLADTGPGSFREAMLTEGPRIIVFRVSGVIALGADVMLEEAHSYVTVAGQTSPGGITIRGGGLVGTYHAGLHDVVLRYLRFRGNSAYDNISFAEVHHLVIDHCDFSGAEDEVVDITFAHDVTFQWSTFTNSGKDGQRYGFLLAYPPTTNISIHHSFSAHHAGRCAPHMHWANGGPPPEGATLDIVNNVFYDCAYEKVFDATTTDSPASFLVNAVGNVAIPGPNTPRTENTHFGNLGEETILFDSDNVYEGGFPFFGGLYHTAMVAAARHPFPPIETQPAAVAREDVLALVGAWPRDAMNVRTIADARAGNKGTLGNLAGALITSGPLPEADTDEDGMPDAWESAHGLDPASGADGALPANEDGYTNVELYLEARADAITGT